MTCKDCRQLSAGTVRNSRSSRAKACGAIAIVAASLGFGVANAGAGVIRVWPSAVVVADEVLLSDLARLTGFDRATERMLAATIITKAPRKGGTRIVHMAMIRDALAAGGANLASLSLGGATRCAISRPLANESMQRELRGVLPPAERPGNRLPSRRYPGAAAASMTGAKSFGTQSNSTLEQAIIDHFDARLARFGGRAEVIFDRGAEQSLALSAPVYTFRVSQKSELLLGLIPVDVDVHANGRFKQTVSLIARVTMTREVVLARRPVNQGAAIREADVERVTMSHSSLDDLPLREPNRVVGQRAKRFMPVGTPIHAGMLEEVPLVKRGQLITLISRAGLVNIVTTGKASMDGLLGDSITVRAVDNSRVAFDATVTGPGEATVGPAPRITSRAGLVAVGAIR